MFCKTSASGYFYIIKHDYVKTDNFTQSNMGIHERPIDKEGLPKKGWDLDSLQI